MTNSYTPTAQDKAAARLYHELTTPDEPYSEAARTEANYQHCRQQLKLMGYVWGRDGYLFQTLLPGMPPDRYVDPQD